MRWKRIGHRGAPHVAPGNTMPSFEAARVLGCDWVECDCRASSDGVIVLAHDDTVHDTHGDSYKIVEQTAADLARLDLGGGAGVPTLEELVAGAVGRVGIMADVKVDGFEAEIGRLLSPLAAEDTVVPGAGDDGRGRFRESFPDLPLSLSVGAGAEAELIRRWSTLDVDAVTLEHPLITPSRVADLHGRNIAVYAWTVDDLETMRALVGMGVDGVISNRADLLMQIADA